MLLVCLIWGANFSVMKGAFDHMPPMAFTAIRFTVSSLLLYGLLRWRFGGIRVAPELRWRMIWMGVLGNTLYQIAFTLSLFWSTATNSALILAAIPAVVTTVAGVRRIERITPRMWAGTAVATIGVALVILASGVHFGWQTMRGDACAVAATLCWALYTVELRRLPPTMPPLQTTALTTFTGTPGLVAAGAMELVALDWKRVPGPAWGALAYASVLSLIVAYVIWNASVQKVGSSRTAIYMCVTPLVAAVVAWLVLGERLVPLQGAGAVLIVAGVLLSRKRER